MSDLIGKKRKPPTSSNGSNGRSSSNNGRSSSNNGKSSSEPPKKVDKRKNRFGKQEEEKKKAALKKPPPKKDETLLKFYYHTRQSNCDERSDLSELTPGKRLQIYSWNVSGLRNIFDFQGTNELQTFINKENPDILCVNETKVTKELVQRTKLDTLLVNKYASFWNTNVKSPGHSGVAVFTKYKPKNVTYGIGKENHDEEARVITLEFETFFLVCVYAPNSGESLSRLPYRTQEWDKDFRNYAKDLSIRKHIIICGDLNVAHKEMDLYSPKTLTRTPCFTNEEREGLDKLLTDVNLVDTFRDQHPKLIRYTYWLKDGIKGDGRNSNQGWRVDYFLVSQAAKDKASNSEMLEDYIGSDHCPIKMQWTV